MATPSKKKSTKLIGYTDDISKMKGEKLYLVIKGKPMPAKEHQSQIVKELLQALDIIKKAKKNGIYVKSNKLFYLTNEDEEYTVVIKEEVESSSEDDEKVLPQKKEKKPLIKKKIESSSEDDEKVLPQKKEKKPLIKKKIESSSEDKEIVPKKTSKKKVVISPVPKKKKPVATPRPVSEDTPSPKKVIPVIMEEKPLLKRRKSFLKKEEVTSSTDEKSKSSIKKEEKAPLKDVVPNTTIFPILETASRRSSLLDKFCDIYKPKYSPPGCKYIGERKDEWAKDAYVDDVTFKKYAPLARLYAPADSNISIIQRLATEREPVNIGMNRPYDAELLNTYFGYKTSYYQRYFDIMGKLAPNIAVYTKAPVKGKDKLIVDVHIYSAIGYALDDKKQPDYKVLHGKEELLLSLYECVFTGIFQCARELKLTRIIMSIVGGGAFANLYPGGADKFQEKIWIPAFTKVMKPHWKDIRIDFMGNKKNVAIKHFIKFGHIIVGNYPDFVYDSTFVPETTLIVNSWDCHSILGNGNKGDDSLDGHVGRSTSIQFFGMGLSNPYLLKNISLVNCSM
jgi:hypothetical protein